MTVLSPSADVAAREECQSSPLERNLQSIGSEPALLSPLQGKATVRLLEDLRARDIELKCDGDRLRVNAPPGALDEETRARIAASKAAIVAFLSARGTKDSAAHTRLRRSGRANGSDDTFPVTQAQLRLWMIQELQPEAGVYNLPYAFRIEGALDAGALAASLGFLVDRHEALRTTFVQEQGVLRQRVASSPAFAQAFTVQREDLRAAPDRLLSILEAEARRPFDLAKGPLFRASIFTLDDRQHVLFFNVHHIVCDGWSIEILLDELGAAYDAFARGAQPILPALPFGPADVALWERENITPARMADALAFFRQLLAGAPEALELPSDRPRGAVFSHRGATHRFAIDRDLVQALSVLGQRHQATLFMVMLAAYEVMLSRWSGQKDIVIGSPVAGRQELGGTGDGVGAAVGDFERMLGCFINVIALRVDLADEPTFLDLLARVRATCLAAYEHQALPFQRLIEALNPARDRSRTAVHQTLFTFQDARHRRMDRGGLRWTRLETIDAGGAKTDLTLLLEQHSVRDATELTGWIEFSTDLFDRETIERFARNYETLLRSIVANPERSVARLDLLHPETRDVLRALNATERSMPSSGSDGFHGLIRAQAWRTPTAVAVVDSTESVTYSELERRANRLANHLLSLGIGRGALVGVTVGRSARMLEATLGILKAGAAYVPLDPDFPSDRLEHMTRDAQLSLVISEEALRARVPRGTYPVLSLDGDANAIAGAAITPPEVRSRADDPAYVIYTSGSTGRPKGVVIPHGAVVNFLVAMAERPGCTAKDRLIAVTTLSFDIAVLELFLPLTVGARTIIASRDAVADGHRLMRLIAEHQATMMQATPVTWQLLVDAGWTGLANRSTNRSTNDTTNRPTNDTTNDTTIDTTNGPTAASPPGLTALCGGEAFPAPLAKDLLDRCAAVWNMYGPTETTVWSACQRLGAPPAPILIGTPIANTQLYVLDEHRQQVPFGVVGELYIGGQGVALGYLHRPELTGERFVPDPFSTDPAARLYRTGDLARQRPDGVLFVGRADNQIKLRGHRIELGEIESVLNGDADVARSAVVVRDFGPGDRRIVAYVVSANPAGAAVDPERLRARARATLPDYMVPQHIVVLEALPLTPNGKIDRKALPTPEVSARSGRSARVAPANALEELLARLWCQTLGLETVGVTDDFFELGGHSLLAVRLVQLIAEACRVSFSLAMVFKAPTIRAQAIAIDAGQDADGISVVPLHAAGEREPVFCICGINLYQDLARTLGADRPVFGVFLPVEGALLTGQATELSVRAMASEYVRAIRAQQPRGPYHLVGVSFGGLLAYETAQQLNALGEAVGTLAILDVVLPNGFDLSWRDWARGHVSRLRAQGPAYAVERFTELREKASFWLDRHATSATVSRLAPRMAPHLDKWLGRLRTTLRPGADGDAASLLGAPAAAGLRQRPGDSMEGHIEALQRLRNDQYNAAWRQHEQTLRPYPGTALVFRARDEERPVGRRVRPDCGWSTYIAPARLSLHEVPGDHLSILTDPYVRELAAALRAHLDASSTTVAP